MGWVFAKPSALLQVDGGDMMAPTALKGPRFSSEQNCACACLCLLYRVKCYACSCWQAPVFSLHEVAIWSLIGQRCHSTTKWSQMAVKTRRGWRLAIVANQGEEVVCNKYCQEQNKISWYPVDAIQSTHLLCVFFFLVATNITLARSKINIPPAYTDYLRQILERRRTRWFHWTGTHIDKKQNNVNLCPVDPSQLLPPILLVICDKYIGKEENQSTRPFFYLRQILKRSKTRWWKISIREMTVKPVRSPTCADWGSFLSIFTFGKIR